MGPIEQAIRRSVSPGDRLATPSRSRPFWVDSFTPTGIVLLLGGGRNRTRIPWECLEGVSKFLTGRGLTLLGGRYSTEGDPDTLDGYLKRFVNRATAGWVASLLEAAGVVEIEVGPPARIRLKESGPEKGMRGADNRRGAET